MNLKLKIISLALFFFQFGCNDGPIFQVTDDGDTIAPIVTITYPAHNSILSDTVAISAFAFDDRALVKTTLYLDDSLIAVKNDTPFTLVHEWITNKSPEDTFRTIWATAEDSAGNFNQTQPVRVFINNVDNQDPVGSFLHPYSGQTVAGEVTILIDASDNESIEFINLFINGDSISQMMEQPYTHIWDTQTYPDDQIYEIHAIIQDKTGNSTAIGPIGVNVDNIDPIDVTPPMGTIYAPASMSTVSGLVNIEISAYDNIDEYPLANINVNGIIICQDLSHPYTCQWNTTEFEDGINIINAELVDGSENSRTLYPISVHLNNYGIPDSTPPSAVIFSPAANETINGNIPISVRADDLYGINRVEYYINHNHVGNQTSIDGALYIYDWDTQDNIEDGEHIIYCITFDNYENHTQTQPFVVNVDNIDNEIPSGYILSPSAGQTVEGFVSIQIVATDNNQIDTVQVMINGAYDNRDATPLDYFYEYLWDTEQEEDDLEYQIYAIIRDVSGNAYNTPSITITVNNNPIPNFDLIPPVVSLQEPTSFQVLSDTVDIVSFAADNWGISHLEILINDVIEITINDSIFDYEWDTTIYSDGSVHSIQVIAYDIHNNHTSTQPIIVTTIQE